MAAKKNQHSGSYANNQQKLDISLVNSFLGKTKNIRDQLIIRLFAETGCTSNELVNIKIKDIDFNANSVTIRAENTRGKRERTISISEKLSLNLKNFSDKNKVYVFSSKKSPRLRTRSIRKIFDKYSKALGVKITSRDLRNLCIKEAISEVDSIEEIKKTIGIQRLDKKEYLTQNQFKTVKKHVKN
jgi:integrase/recombinase XerD